MGRSHRLPRFSSSAPSLSALETLEQLSNQSRLLHFHFVFDGFALIWQSIEKRYKPNISQFKAISKT